MNREQLEINLKNHKERGVIDIFDDKDYPSEIIFESPTYGKYKLKPFFYINLRGDSPELISDAMSEINNISPTRSAWNLNMIKVPGSERKASVEWIWYFIDWDSNLDWVEINKDIDYLKKYPSYKRLPIADPNINKVVQKIWEKYPMTKLDNYQY